MSDADTLKTEKRRSASRDHIIVVATVACHPDLSRVGERALLGKVADVDIGISREGPDFAAIDSLSGTALADRYISRRPVRFRSDGGELSIDATDTSMTVRVAGNPIERVHRIAIGELDRGVVLRIGRVVLVVHSLHGLSAPTKNDRGLAGHSDALRRVREHIGRIATEPLPVLIRGESGVGKELVARAIHAAGARSEGPFIALNMAAVPAGTAAAELFGHARGAFTGAVDEHAGAFGRADGGTLFLDEIGEATTDVQAMLLRVLETGELQQLGARGTKRVDVRVIAATDAALEAAIERGAFRLPLLHRLAGYEIHIPPLRERRDDIGILFASFVREQPSLPEGWLSAEVAEKLLLYAWPGNVRQLRNTARQMLVTSAGLETAEAPDLAVARAAATPSRPIDISDELLEATLRDNRWEPTAAARALGISKAALYDRIAHAPHVRTAADLGAEEIREALSAHHGNANHAAMALCVSSRGLRRRMTKLDIT